MPIGLAGLACARTVPVQAPMIAADAVPAIASPRPVPSASAAKDPDGLPFHRGQLLAGSYVCTQGKTRLTFVFDDVKGGVDDGIYVDVTFAFVHDGAASGTSAASGSARMKGTFDPKTRRLRLHAEEWIEQPPSYTLVDFAGSVSRAGVYSGRVEGRGCTTFTASPDRDDDTP